MQHTYKQRFSNSFYSIYKELARAKKKLFEKKTEENKKKNEENEKKPLHRNNLFDCTVFV